MCCRYGCRDQEPDLYNENGLELEELMCKLDLMDEAYYVLNSDAYGRLKYKKMMQQFMEEV